MENVVLQFSANFPARPKVNKYYVGAWRADYGELKDKKKARHPEILLSNCPIVVFPSWTPTYANFTAQKQSKIRNG